MIRRLGAVLACVVCVAAAAAPASAQAPAPAPGRWEAEIAVFEAQDRVSPPPGGEIVFVGSSSIRLWDTRKYFPDLTIINRGFGGSQLADVVRFAGRIVIPYQPRIVVVYAGDNDIYAGATSEQVAIHFEQFVRTLRAALPDVRVIFIGIKPSLSRWAVVDRMRLANDLIKAFAARDDGVAFVDTDHVMLGWDEEPRRELFVPDGLHLTADGYQLWAALLRPLLDAR